MLRTRNVASVLEQSVDGTSVISSILINKSGQALSSYSRSKIPPAPKTSAPDGAVDDDITQPYKVDRALKVKICSIFGSLVWEEYIKAANNKQIEYIALETDLAQWVIRPVKLEASADPLLLVILAERSMAPGLLCKLSQQTASTLEDGLQSLKVST
jgi:hypothetical protein